MESPRAEREPSPEAAAAESRELAVLREMMLRARREGEDPQMPDEQLRSNDQLQQDEVLPDTFSDRSFLRGYASPLGIDLHFSVMGVIAITHRPRRIRRACLFGLGMRSNPLLGVPATSRHSYLHNSCIYFFISLSATPSLAGSKH